MRTGSALRRLLRRLLRLLRRPISHAAVRRWRKVTKFTLFSFLIGVASSLTAAMLLEVIQQA